MCSAGHIHYCVDVFEYMFLAPEPLQLTWKASSPVDAVATTRVLHQHCRHSFEQYGAAEWPAVVALWVVVHYTNRWRTRFKKGHCGHKDNTTIKK